MANPILDGGYASDFDIYSVYTPSDLGPGGGLRIGTRGVLDDRTFHWTRFISGTACANNKVMQAAVPEAAHTSESGAIGNASAGTSVAANSTRIYATLGAAVAGQQRYQEGYLKIESATGGAGQIYKIKGHDYTASAGEIVLDLYDPVKTAISGSPVWTLLNNPWADPVILPTTATSAVVGVPLCSFAAATTASSATTNYLRTAASTWTLPQYGWVQTWGLCSVLIDTGNLVAGSGVIAGTTTAGAATVEAAAGVTNRIGYALEALSTDNAYATVFLQIAL